MFAFTENRAESSEVAGLQMKLGSCCVALRVRLQRLIDPSNKLPVSLISKANSSIDSPSNEDKDQSKEKISRNLFELCVDLKDILNDQVEMTTNVKEIKKRSRQEEINEETMNSEQLWESILQPQKQMKEKWEETVNKFHARAYFGSEGKKAKLTIFNQSIWDQIHTALSDPQRVIEKSCMPWKESQRINKENKNSSKLIKNEYDEEVYDDRLFYSHLVKSFVSMMSGNDSMNLNGIKEDDLNVLRKLKKRKDNVDRKASKGRKIRYIVHSKLQNFMFPIPKPAPPMDIDRLYQSLFQ